MTMQLVRPNADELLKQVQADEQSHQRGRLKIFLGYAAGLGKTYAMLEAAPTRPDRFIPSVIWMSNFFSRRGWTSIPPSIFSTWNLIGSVDQWCRLPDTGVSL